MNSRKNFTIQGPTRRGKFIVREFGRAAGDGDQFPTLEEARVYARARRRAYLLDLRKSKRLSREADRLEKRCSTPERYSRQVRLQRALHEAYQGVCISARRSASYERHLTGTRKLSRRCDAAEEAESAQQIYDRAAHAHHLAAVARRSGYGAGWDRAMDILEGELKKIDSLRIYGIGALDL